VIAMLLADTSAPAGGAPFEDLVPATIVGVVALIGLAVIAAAYLRGRAAWLDRAAGSVTGITELPPWAALPMVMTTASLLAAVFGFYWDVSSHIDNGRDPGPFANPSHYFILFGLAGIAVAGLTAILLGMRHDTPRATRVFGVPLGGALLTLCGVVAVSGFPLDDVWHRLFGQDVTLWGPTHIQMVGGAALSTLAQWILLSEARLQSRGHREHPITRVRSFLLAGAFLVGLSALQAEFDFGVPQFQLVYQPILIMMAAGIALVSARIRLGPGGAIGAVLFFLVLRALLTLAVGPVLGRTAPHFPLYLVEAIAVELIALRIAPKSLLRFALVSGIAIGTAGLAAEWAWSHLWMPIPWPSNLLPEGLILGLLAAVSGAVLGASIGNALDWRSEDAPRIRLREVAVALGAALICLAWPAPTQSPRDVRGSVALDFSKDRSAATVTVRVDPPKVADDPMWFHALSWQGLQWRDGSRPLVEMTPVGDATYRSVQPLPISGDWKTLIRLHNEGYLVALPVYLPKDEAIPAPAVPVAARFERTFVADKELLQREALGGNLWLQRGGYLILLAIAAGWILALGLGLARLGRAQLSRTVGLTTRARPRETVPS
jgi:hypothetical protein